jgi:hypothetical protein
MQQQQRVRRTTDGQLGFLIEEDGKQRVKLDRRTGETVPYHPTTWVPDVAPRLNEAQLSRILYGADRELRIARGEYSVLEWTRMHERDRVGWKLPETADATRQAMSKAIRQVLAKE